MSHEVDSAPDILATLRSALQTPIRGILDHTDALQHHAHELGQEVFLPELQKIQSAARQLLVLVHELVGASSTGLEEVDFPRLRFEVRTALNHTIGYVEMLQERAVELDQGGFVPELEQVHAQCHRLLAEVQAPEHSPAEPVAGTVAAQSDPGSSTHDETMPTAGTVLVVDDNTQNRKLLGGQLRRQGFRVVQAGSGPAAMERLRAEMFDLVLLDVVMPGISGYEMLQWLKADPRLRDIPVLMIAAMNETESVVRCLVIGAEDYIAPPFDPILLKARVGSCLERTRWRRQEKAYLRQIEEEQALTERLFRNVLPKPIVDRVRQGEIDIADTLSDVTILFADLVSFTTQSASMPAGEVVKLLNEIFVTFDRLAEERQVERIKTIGDAYMAVGGLNPEQRDHACIVADFALAMQRAMASLRITTQRPLHLWIGIHTGPVIAGIVGRQRFSYDIWGDTVNTASRMEAHSEPDRIHVSAATCERIRDRYHLEKCGEFEARGNPPMTTYYLTAENPPSRQG